ncbi:MAG: DJ-1/PfpI family protein [Paraprevotella sp.]|nr:DJ-1/PfpI family protein [Paraprevotella sp.]MBP3471584.1 DJ-1/PfpI family protein [Paraprevotella sp.]
MNMIYVFAAEGFEDIELLAVVDILRRAELPVRIVSVTEEKWVASAHGVRLEADLLFEEMDKTGAELLVLPGGLPGAHNLAAHDGLAEVIRKHYEAGKLLAANCAAPLVYGRMGLLHGVKATCYPGFEPELEGAVPTGALVEHDGQFVTAKGPAATFPFAYLLVELLAGKEKADALREGMIFAELVK